MKKKIIWTVIIIIILLCAWAPWITESYAINKVTRKFNEKNEGIIDGCGFNCEGCVVNFEGRTLFGTKVSTAYSCGMYSPNHSPEFTKTYFIPFFGTTMSFMRTVTDYTP